MQRSVISLCKKDMTAWEAALNDSNFCLKIVEGKLELNKKHY